MVTYIIKAVDKPTAIAAGIALMESYVDASPEVLAAAERLLNSTQSAINKLTESINEDNMELEVHEVAAMATIKISLEPNPQAAIVAAIKEITDELARLKN